MIKSNKNTITWTLNSYVLPLVVHAVFSALPFASCIFHPTTQLKES